MQKMKVSNEMKVKIGAKTNLNIFFWNEFTSIVFQHLILLPGRKAMPVQSYNCKVVNFTNNCAKILQTLYIRFTENGPSPQFKAE